MDYGEVTMLREATRTCPAILLTSGVVTHPGSAGEFFQSAALLTELNIGTILNVSVNESVTDDHRRLWQRLGIYYQTHPIHDNILDAPPEDFITNVLRAYSQHMRRVGCGADRAILINCSAGINRSAFAAGVILWATTPERPWGMFGEMVRDMRTRQYASRRLDLLRNNVFEQRLEDFCNSTT
jgi:hypothetical protein